MFRMRGLSRASLWGEAGSRDRERGEVGVDVLLRLSGVGVGMGEQGRTSLRVVEAWFRDKEGGELGGYASLSSS